MRWSAIAFLLLTACGGAGPAVPQTGAASPAAAPSQPPAEVEGIITELATAGEEITSLTIESARGTFEVLIDPARDYGFDLAHLHEHRDLRDPVRVTIEVREGQAYAVTIEDVEGG